MNKEKVSIPRYLDSRFCCTYVYVYMYPRIYVCMYLYTYVCMSQVHKAGYILLHDQAPSGEEGANGGG